MSVGSPSNGHENIILLARKIEYRKCACLHGPPTGEQGAPLFRFGHAHPLGYRILGYIVLFSSVLALLTTAVQLFSDYRLDVHAIDDRMEQIERSYLKTIANSLWTFDEPQIKIQIEGIVALPDIKFVVVDTPFGQRYLSGTEPQNFAAITRSFPLDYNDGEKVAHLGSLTVSASLEGVYQRLRHRVFLILITNAVKNFLIALFILFIFQRLVTRHLGTMAEYARGLDLNSLHLPLILPRKARSKSPDELDQVTSAINEMRLSLLGGMAERKRAEEAVRESETRFRSLFEQAAVGMAEVAPDGRFMRVNDRLCAITGYPREKLQAKTYQELTHPDDMDITLKEARRLEIGEISQHALEKRYLRKDGSVVWVRRTVSTIRKPDGTLDHYIAVIEDVTARKLAEEEISKLNAGLEQRVSERTAQLQAATRNWKLSVIRSRMICGHRCAALMASAASCSKITPTSLMPKASTTCRPCAGPASEWLNLSMTCCNSPASRAAKCTLRLWT